MTLAQHHHFFPAGLFAMPEALSAVAAGELLRTKRDAKGMTQEQVASALGLANPNYVSLLEKGKVNLSRSKYLPALVRVLGLNEREVSEINPDMIVEVYEAPQVEELSVHQVPIRNMACAGEALYTEEAVLGVAYVDDRLFRDDMMVVLVNGESMAPTIQSGDEVYIDTHQLEPAENKVFLVHIPGDGLVLKRAMRVAGHWMLISDNRKYPPLSPHEGVILGRAYHHKPRGSDL